MARIHIATALALFASAAVFACTTRTEVDTTTTGRSDGPQENPSNPTPAPAPQRSPRPALSAGRVAALSSVLSLDGADGGTDSGTPSTSVSTDRSSYSYGDPVTITFGNMQGNTSDWVGFAPAGSPATEYSWYAYTNGALSGTATTGAGDFLPPGTYVARAFYADGYTVAAESAQFTVGATTGLTATVTTDKSAYGGFESIGVTFSGLSGSADVTVTASPTYGSTGMPYALVDAGNVPGGTIQLSDLLAGTYEVRVFEGTTWKGTSGTFTVSPAVSTDKSSYALGDPVVVHFAGMQGLSTGDFIAISTSGVGSTQYTLRQNADWYWSGTRTFDSTTLGTGTYVARIYFDFDTNMHAESAPFTVGP